MNEKYFTDILLSYDTDIEFGGSDLLITTGQDHIKRKIHKLLITEPGDWKVHINVGASPTLFIGEKNNRETGNRIKEYLMSKIQPFIYPSLLDVKVVPIDYDNVTVYIDVFMNSQIISASTFTIDFVNGISYSQFDDVVDKVVSSNILKQNNITNINTPNPYLDKLRFR